MRRFAPCCAPAGSGRKRRRVKFSGNASHGESRLTERGSNPARLTLSLLGQQSFGYGPGAKCPRGNIGAGVVGYLFETAHQAIAPTRQAGAHIRSREVSGIVEGAHGNLPRKPKRWLEHELGHAAETREGSSRFQPRAAAALRFQRGPPKSPDRSVDSSKGGVSRSRTPSRWSRTPAEQVNSFAETRAPSTMRLKQARCSWPPT